MKHILLLIIFSAASQILSAQPTKLPFNTVTAKDLNSTTYVDSTATILILDERCQAVVDMHAKSVKTNYYFKIKILTKAGLDAANFAVPVKVGKQKKDFHEKFSDFAASSYAIKDGLISETKMKGDQVFTQNMEDYDLKKFAVPNVSVGSVIEVRYSVTTPGYAIKTWDFQSGAPKIRSEMSSYLPGGFRYNIILKGDLKLASKKRLSVPGIYSSDIFVMENIPAFKDEPFTQSRRTYLSAVQFDLASVFDKPVIRDWASVDRQLLQESGIGLRVKEGIELVKPKVAALTGNPQDSLMRARQIYKMISHEYSWNDKKSLFPSADTKFIIEQKTGNSADLNLLLTSAFVAAGYRATLVILSTADNGIPNTLYPDIGEFNYLLVAVFIGKDTYLLDANDPLLPFGLLPLFSCNVVGHVIGSPQKTIDLVASTPIRLETAAELAMDKDGIVTGSIKIRHFGYAAYLFRRGLKKEGLQADIEKKIQARFPALDINHYTIDNPDNLDSAVTEKMDVKIVAGTVAGGNTFFLNPFPMNTFTNNPFQSEQRQYPLDLSAPTFSITELRLNIPREFSVEDMPAVTTILTHSKKDLFSIESNLVPSGLKIKTTFVIAHSIIPVKDYSEFRDLFSRVIQIQQSQITLKRNKVIQKPTKLK